MQLATAFRLAISFSTDLSIDQLTYRLVGLHSTHLNSFPSPMDAPSSSTAMGSKGKRDRSLLLVHGTRQCGAQTPNEEVNRLLRH